MPHDDSSRCIVVTYHDDPERSRHENSARDFVTIVCDLVTRSTDKTLQCVASSHYDVSCRATAMHRDDPSQDVMMIHHNEFLGCIAMHCDGPSRRIFRMHHGGPPCRELITMRGEDSSRCNVMVAPSCVEWRFIVMHPDESSRCVGVLHHDASLLIHNDAHEGSSRCLMMSPCEKLQEPHSPWS